MKIVGVLCLLLFTVAANAGNRFVYVNNQNSPNTISAFQVNHDGSLVQLVDSPFRTGGAGAEGPTESMAIVKRGETHYLYAANGQDGTISAFMIDTATGNLQLIAGSPFLVGDSSGTYDMAASPNHEFLFVSNEVTTVIHVFAISKVNGSLSEIAGSPFPASANITGFYVTANSRFLLVAANSINAVEIFSIAKTGEIAEIQSSPFPGSGSVTAVQANCASDRVFAVSNSSNYVDTYTMAAGGELTPVPGSPFWNGAGGTGPNSFDLVLAPKDGYLFTTDSFSNDITSFAVVPDGSLSQITGSPFATSSWEGGMTVTRDGRFVYSVQFVSGQVDGRKVSRDGSLSAVPGTPFGPGNQNSLNGEVNSVIAFPPPVCSARARGE
jgi:6-phosphogluconolactonase (cycloisomerase 2 family)